MKVFKIYVPKKELDEYLDPMCVLCGRRRSAINKHVDLKGMKVLGGISVIKINDKPQPICDECLYQKKRN